MAKKKPVPENVKYIHDMQQSDRDIMLEGLKIAYESFGIMAKLGEQLEPDTYVDINWACAWNKPKRVGTTGLVIVSADRMSLVLFPPGNSSTDTEVYRNEDLTPVAGTLEVEIEV